MNIEKIESLYGMIGNKLNELIPVEWSNVALYCAVSKGYIGHWFYFKSNGKWYDSGVIRTEYNIDKMLIRELEKQLTSYVKEMNNEFKNSEKGTWYSMNFIMNNDGKFEIEFDYEDLEQELGLKFRELWKEKYLK